MSGYVEIERELSVIEYYVRQLESRLNKPFRIIDGEMVRGHRFGNPGILNYVVLNISNSVSTIRASIELLKIGFNTQSMMLMRFVMEQDSKLMYVLAGVSLNGIDKKSSNFLAEYFRDNDRTEGARRDYKPINQKDIHRRNSEKITEDLKIVNSLGLGKGQKNDDDNFAKLQSSLYKTFSNFVHGRYPEAMTIYGEKSNELNMAGDLESKDIDTRHEIQFVALLTNTLLKKLKLSLMALQTARIIQLTKAEAEFALREVF